VHAIQIWLDDVCLNYINKSILKNWPPQISASSHTYECNYHCTDYPERALQVREYNSPIVRLGHIYYVLFSCYSMCLKYQFRACQPKNVLGTWALQLGMTYIWWYSIANPKSSELITLSVCLFVLYLRNTVIAVYIFLGKVCWKSYFLWSE